MRTYTTLTLLCCCLLATARGTFPDGSPISKWFDQDEVMDIPTSVHRFVLTDYGVRNDSTLLQTNEIQAVIDKAAKNGGVVVVPSGTFLSGALFFKPGTHLYLQKGAVLKGSDDISHFPILQTRIEGQTLPYFSALINADSLDGFSISGQGTIDGNGLRYWKSFWLRRQVNPACTNMDEMRPRLVYLANCTNVQLSGVRLVNSPFWTTHLYKCNRVKLLGLTIFAPSAPVKAPSSDAVDIDACSNVLIKNCNISVCDDAIALKGGKGPLADTDARNGSNESIIIEDCHFGFCYGALTCGSEAVHCRNIVLRRCTLDKANRLLWLKMRPDTPQKYEYMLVEDIRGNADNLLYVRPWMQFFDLKGRTDIPISYAQNITFRDIRLDCTTFFNVEKSTQYQLSAFTFDNMQLQVENVACAACDTSVIVPMTLKNVRFSHR